MYNRAVEMATEKNPFVPSFGEYPPCLAGREAAQAMLREKLGRIAAGLTPAGQVMLAAPRGMGKTVLLDWVEDSAPEPVNVLQLKASQIRNLPSLFTRLWPGWDQAGGERRLAGLEVAGQVSLTGAGGKVNLSAHPPPPPPTDLLPLIGALEQHIVTQARAVPQVVLVDEAHEVDAEVGEVLLNAIQEVVKKKAPILLVLAGTPGLESHLQRIRATFGGDRHDPLYLGELSPAATREAIVTPLPGWQIDGDALAEVIRDARGYPYFIQLWGKALWDAGQASQAITAETVATARTVVDTRRIRFYENRYRELAELPDKPAGVPMKAVVAAVASVCRSGDRQSDDTLTGVIEAALPADLQATDQATAILVKLFLEARGFIWQAGGNSWVPGIPSLVDYVLKQRSP